MRRKVALLLVALGFGGFLAINNLAPVVGSSHTAAVITIGTATLATFVGGGGLGEPIQEGLSMLDNRLVLLGAIPAAILALVVDGLLALVERAVRPRGV